MWREEDYPLWSDDEGCEVHFYHTHRPWRGLEITKVCVCILVSQPWFYRAVGCYGDFRETLCVSDCRISRSEHVMLKVAFNPHRKLRHTKMGTELNLEGSLVLGF